MYQHFSEVNIVNKILRPPCAGEGLSSRVLVSALFGKDVAQQCGLGTQMPYIYTYLESLFDGKTRSI
jgi:hypothetical protein